MLGIVPSTSPERRPSAEQLAATAAALTDRLGFPRRFLAERIGVTPACGLAGATPEWARTAVELAQKTADPLAQDPEAMMMHQVTVITGGAGGIGLAAAKIVGRTHGVVVSDVSKDRLDAAADELEAPRHRLHGGRL